MTKEEFKNLKVNDYIRFKNANNIIFCYKVMGINQYGYIIKLIYTNNESYKDIINASYIIDRCDYDNLGLLTDEEKVEYL